MNILYLLVPLAILLAGMGVAGFVWSVRTGQYDDVETPAMRVIIDDDVPEPQRPDSDESDDTGANNTKASS